MHVIQLFFKHAVMVRACRLACMQAGLSKRRLQQSNHQKVVSELPDLSELVRTSWLGRVNQIIAAAGKHHAKLDKQVYSTGA